MGRRRLRDDEDYIWDGDYRLITVRVPPDEFAAFTEICRRKKHSKQREILDFVRRMIAKDNDQKTTK